MKRVAAFETDDGEVFTDAVKAAEHDAKLKLTAAGLANAKGVGLFTDNAEVLVKALLPLAAARRRAEAEVLGEPYDPIVVFGDEFIPAEVISGPSDEQVSEALKRLMGTTPPWENPIGVAPGTPVIEVPEEPATETPKPRRGKGKDAAKQAANEPKPVPVEAGSKIITRDFLFKGKITKLNFVSENGLVWTAHGPHFNPADPAKSEMSLGGADEWLDLEEAYEAAQRDNYLKIAGQDDE